MAIATCFGMTRILLVEDSNDVLDLLQIELQWMGYVVEGVSDSMRAIEAARLNPPDVIVSDLGMPGIDGFELIRRIRANQTLAGIPAIALTGFSRSTEVQQALAWGFTAHLAKPVDAEQLSKLIGQLTSTRTLRKAS